MRRLPHPWCRYVRGGRRTSVRSDRLPGRSPLLVTLPLDRLDFGAQQGSEFTLYVVQVVGYCPAHRAGPEPDHDAGDQLRILLPADRTFRIAQQVGKDLADILPAGG